MSLVREHYERRIAELKAELATLESKGDALSRYRGISFLAALGLGIAGLVRGFTSYEWALAGAPLIVFAGLVVRHAFLASHRHLVEERAQLNERGLARMRGEPEPARFGDTFGERFLKGEHPNASDLDLFGKTSIFRLLSRAETSVGEETLARWLLSPATAEEIAARQAAVRELMEKPRLLEDLAVHAKRAESRGRTEDPLVAWAEAPAELPVPGARGEAEKRKSWVLAARVLVPLTILAFAVSEIAPRLPAVASALPKWFSYAYFAPLALQVVVLGALFSPLSRMITFVTSRETPFGRFVGLFALLEKTTFESPLLQSLAGALRESEAGPAASVEIARLERAVSFADLRHNGVIHILANMTVLYDVWCALALERWRVRSGRRARGWLRAVGAIEALGSLAVFAAEHPDYAFPEIVEGPPTFEVEALGHPLIPESKRVSNTYTFEGPGHAMLITGPNMSGKSTWLRSMGIAVVMAMSGAVVAAKRARFSRLEVWTSMRIRDSLSEGLSHFYAELMRLKAIEDAVRKTSDGRGPKVLFLLDEVLHGTNSRERTLGAKSVVTFMIGRGAIGAVSSHDLHLASLEEESGKRVKNHHFSDLIEGGKMTFDYRLKVGTVRSTNALRLMRLVGLAVQDTDGQEDDRAEGAEAKPTTNEPASTEETAAPPSPAPRG